MTEIAIPTGRRPHGRVRDEAAIATWKLRRTRRVRPPLGEQAGQLRRTMADAQVLADRQFCYRGRRAALRPTVAAMLVRLWLAGGAAVPAADLCAAMYGRPASLRALRQAAFRASRAMERVDCPLVVCCQAGTVFVSVRVRVFERSAAGLVSVPHRVNDNPQRRPARSEFANAFELRSAAN